MKLTKQPNMYFWKIIVISYLVDVNKNIPGKVSSFFFFYDGKALSNLFCGFSINSYYSILFICLTNTVCIMALNEHQKIRIKCLLFGYRRSFNTSCRADNLSHRALALYLICTTWCIIGPTIQTINIQCFNIDMYEITSRGNGVR